MKANNKFRINYFFIKSSKDIIKGFLINDKTVTGYIKYRHVNFNTERQNKYGNYNVLHYPFDSFTSNKERENKYIEELGCYLPCYDISEVEEINQFSTLTERLSENKFGLQMKFVKEMLVDFSQVKYYSLDKFGLDASLQCRLETEASDIDMVVQDKKLYLELYQYIKKSPNYSLFSNNIVDRRGSYSSFVSTKELITFEGRKISFIYKAVKVSILLINSVEIPEDIAPTGSFVYLSASPGLYTGLGEPSLIKLDNIQIIYGPNINYEKNIYYLSALPVRTGFVLTPTDQLIISGYIYISSKTKTVYVCQFIWDYCKLFKAHNIALNTTICEDLEDKKIVGHFFENIKL